MTLRSRLLIGALALLLAGAAVIAVGYRNATRDPVIRTAILETADWPAGAPPLRVLFLTDIHVAGPDMPPGRVRAILQRLNRLRPDLVLVGGDLISEKALATRLYPARGIVAALLAAQAPLGVVVAAGNHDHWAGIEPFRRAMAEAGLPFPVNTALRRGPLRIAVLDDEMTGNADPAAAVAALDRLGPGPAILLNHSPDVVPRLPRLFAAVFAGHTHCGQIVLPLVGALSYASRYGARFGCGDIADGGQRVFVSAGLGTSVLPLRFGAPPDVWLVTIGPRR